MKPYAITHSGKAHRDEFLALSLLVARGLIYKIERREPAADELNNPQVWVIDTGEEIEGLLRHRDNDYIVIDVKKMIRQYIQ